MTHVLSDNLFDTDVLFVLIMSATLHDLIDDWLRVMSVRYHFPLILRDITRAGVRSVVFQVPIALKRRDIHSRSSRTKGYVDIMHNANPAKRKPLPAMHRLRILHIGAYTELFRKREYMHMMLELFRVSMGPT